MHIFPSALRYKAPNETISYTYNTLGALTEVTTPTKTITYHLNALNQRVAKEVNGVITEKYLWADLTTLLAVYDANDNLVQRFEYAESRMPISMTQDNQKYYLHYDQVGTLRAVSDINQTILKEITYDTFGNILSDTNENFKVPFGFAGGLHDRDTNLVHFGYREYDPYTGKWTAKDPIGFDGGDSNLYGYVLGNPVDFVDPSGLVGISEVSVGIGLLLGGKAWYDGISTMRNGAEKAKFCSELLAQIDFTLKASHNSCMPDSERFEFEARLLQNQMKLEKWCKIGVGRIPFE